MVKHYFKLSQIYFNEGKSNRTNLLFYMFQIVNLQKKKNNSDCYSSFLLFATTFTERTLQNINENQRVSQKPKILLISMLIQKAESIL